MDKGNAKIVFNKPFIINKIEKTSDTFVMTLQDFPIEYINDTTPANTAKLFNIWKEDGILKFGGSYGTVTTE